MTLTMTLNQAMSALVAHSPRAREALSDRFDAQWIAQQAAILTMARVRVRDTGTGTGTGTVRV